MKFKRMKRIMAMAMGVAMTFSSLGTIAAYASEETEIKDDVQVEFVDSLEELDLQELIPEEFTAFAEAEDHTQSRTSDSIDLADEVVMPASRTRSLLDGSLSGYLTAEGQLKAYSLDLPAGFFLQAQLDLPRNSGLDYDLYLTDSEFNVLEYSEYWTYVNGTSGTISETLGYGTQVSDTYYLVVQSAVGASISEAFTLHYAVSAPGEYDDFEADDNARYALPLTIGDAGGEVNIRNINSYIDTDWYKIDIPAGRSYDTVNFSVSTSSPNTCGIEIYKNAGDGYFQMVKQNLSGGNLTVSTGTYYVKVYNTASNFDSSQIQNYSLKMNPILRATGIAITDLSGTEGLNKIATYYGVSRFRTKKGNLDIMGVVYADINGSRYPVENATIVGLYYNPYWDANNTPDFAYRDGEAVSDATGRFSVRVTLPNAVGALSSYVTVSTHYFDDCAVAAFVKNQTNIQDEKLIWHFAYSM